MIMDLHFGAIFAEDSVEESKIPKSMDSII